MNITTIDNSHVTTDFVNFAKVYRKLRAEHSQEWLDSAVNVDIIRLNVESLQGNQGFNYILYSDDIPRRNDGRVTDSILQRYRHLEDGGWYCSGIDPLTGQASDWGCFKPDQPYLQSERKGFGEPVKQKLIKYEHPFKTPTELFCLRIPLTLWQLIADRYQLPLPENIIVDSTGEALGFWQWVIEQSVPIVITEGAKKAGALLSAGYVAIALPGIYNGYRTKDKDGNMLVQPELIPQLKIFCQTQREFIFCFDQDSKPTAAKNVQTAIAKTGKLLKATGCSVSVMSWYLPHKGIDDLIVAQGTEYLDYLYQNRLSLDRFCLHRYLDLTPFISQRVNVRFLGEESNPPANAQLIFYQSPKGTGKTRKFAQAALHARQQGRAVLCLTHRSQLGLQIAECFTIPYRTELGDETTTSVFGYVLCVDSLHAQANPGFHPEQWEDCDLFIDEIEQFLWHLLNSATCQRHRVAILQTFTQLLSTIIINGGRIWCGDADLTRRSVDYLLRVIQTALLNSGETASEISIQPWVLVNEWQPAQQRRAYLYPTCEAWLSDVMACLSQGMRLMIHTSAQSMKTRYGTINLERMIKKQFPHLRVLRIDRESVADSLHPAYGCMAHINEVVRQYDVVVASPTLETGVSIEGGHFHRSFVYGSGKQTVEAVVQSPARIRDNISIHIYVNQFSTERIGNGSFDPQVLLTTQKKVFKTNAHLLGQADAISALDGESAKHLSTWAIFAAAHNYGFQHYREQVYEHLRRDGYSLMEVESPEDAPMWKEQAKESADENFQSYCETVAMAPLLNEVDYQRLQQQSTRTETERIAEHKTNLTQRYLTEDITPDLVRADDQGLYGQLQLHYFLTIGHQFLKERDRQKTERITHQGKVFAPDYNQVTLSAKVTALKLLNIEQFLTGETFTSESLQEWFTEMILPYRRDIKIFLNQTVNPDKDTPIGVAQRLLGLMGFKMTCIERRRVNGKITRFYAMIDFDAQGRNAIFERWFDRDSQTSCDTPSINKLKREMA